MAEIKKNQISLKHLSWRELRPGMSFMVFNQEEPSPGNPLPSAKPWQFEVKTIFPLRKLAQVIVTYPKTGDIDEAFFDEVKIGGVLRVYLDSEKNGYFFDLNTVDILVWN